MRGYNGQDQSRLSDQTRPEIDSCEDVELLKNISKSYVKLYLKQQETVASMAINL